MDGLPPLANTPRRIHSTSNSGEPIAATGGYVVWGWKKVIRGFREVVNTKRAPTGAVEKTIHSKRRRPGACETWQRGRDEGQQVMGFFPELVTYQNEPFFRAERVAIGLSRKILSNDSLWIKERKGKRGCFSSSCGLNYEYVVGQDN